jgi:hypothetical protein
MTTSSSVKGAGTGPRRRLSAWGGFWRRGRGFWWRREAPPLNIVDSVTFQTPSYGEAFGFTVVMRCCWCAIGGRNREDMKRAISERRPQDVRHVRRIVREAVRGLQPWEASVAEERANRSLSEQHDGVLAREEFEYDISTTCSVWVEIDVAEPVRKFQQKEMRARMGWAAHKYSSEQTLTTLTRLRGDWLEFLGGSKEQADGDWRTPFATQLAESGGRVTETVASMHWRRRKDVSFAATFYSDVIKEIRAAGDYDFAIAVEDTLGKMVSAYQLPKIDLVGEMLQQHLMASDEHAPMGHMFGTETDGTGPTEPVTEMFGGRSSSDGGAHNGWSVGPDLLEESANGRPVEASESTDTQGDAEAESVVETGEDPDRGAETGEDTAPSDKPEDDGSQAAEHEPADAETLTDADDTEGDR